MEAGTTLAVREAGVRDLADIEQLPNLQQMDLSQNQVQDLLHRIGRLEHTPASPTRIPPRRDW